MTSRTRDNVCPTAAAAGRSTAGGGSPGGGSPGGGGGGGGRALDSWRADAAATADAAAPADARPTPCRGTATGVEWRSGSGRTLLSGTCGSVMLFTTTQNGLF